MGYREPRTKAESQKPRAESLTPIHGRDRSPTAIGTAGPPAETHRRPAAHAAAARRQSAGVDRDGQPRARGRPPGVSRPAEERGRGSRSRRPARDRRGRGDPPDGEGSQRNQRHHRRTVARPHHARHPDRHEHAGTDHRAPREIRRLDRRRRSHSTHSGTHRQGVVALDGTPRRSPRRRHEHRRPIAAGVRHGDPDRHEAGRQAGDARGQRPAQEAGDRLGFPGARGLAARSEGQDRVAGAAGDDRRAAAGTTCASSSRRSSRNLAKAKATKSPSCASASRTRSSPRP